MLVIDRLEGEYAVCEDSETLKITKLPKVFLPQNVKEGDCLVQVGTDYKIDAIATLNRRKSAKQQLDNLYN